MLAGRFSWHNPGVPWRSQLISRVCRFCWACICAEIPEAGIAQVVTDLDRLATRTTHPRWKTSTPCVYSASVYSLPCKDSSFFRLQSVPEWMIRLPPAVTSPIVTPYFSPARQATIFIGLLVEVARILAQ